MLELIVVIAIAGIMVLVSVPHFTAIRRRTQLRSAAMEISTTLVAARMRAVRRGANTTVVVTPAASPAEMNTIKTIEPTPAVAPTPSAIILTDLVITGKTLRFVQMPPNGIGFDGAGRQVAPPPPTPGFFVIEGPLNGGPINQIKIETNAAGRVRIVTPVDWQ